MTPGSFSRLFLKALARGDRDLAVEDIRWSDAICELPDFDTTLLKTLTRCEWPSSAAKITSCIPTLCEPDRRAALNILRTTFETDRIPGEWLPILERFDEVWVLSKHNELSFRRSGVAPEKLRLLPGFIDTALFTARGRRIPLPNELADRFVFLSVFDWQLRKGWDVLLRAYCSEFSPADGVGLLLKLTMAHGHTLGAIHRQADACLSQLSQSLEGRPDIVLWGRTLNTLDMAALYRSVDAFVLASRGEGWGRPYMEAMACGVPTIGTRGSGNDDFMDDENSFLVSTTSVDVPEAAAAEIPVYRGHRWLEPDETELRSIMRRVFSNEQLRRSRARKGVALVRTAFSVDSARQAVEQNLHAAEARFQGEELPQVDESQVRLELEGEFFARHSFANINEKLSLEFIKTDRVALSLRRLRHNPTFDHQAPQAHELAPYMGRALPKGPQITIRHAFPPNWNPVDQGRWVHIQPWEFGPLPIDWVPPLRDRVDEIWAPSTYVKRAYEQSGIPADKVHVIPWGIDPDVYQPKAIPLLMPTDRRFRFLFVGGTIHRKGFDLLFETYREEFTSEDDVCLVVKDIGTNTFYRYGNWREQIFEAMQDPSGPEIVYIDSDMTPGQLASLYTACDCLVAPYRGEGFGLPILEAMACGIPAIVPRGGASDDFVTDASGYLLAAEEVECQHDWRTCGIPTELSIDLANLRTTMRDAYDNPQQTVRKGELAAADVHDRFTWDKTARMMMDRVESIVRGDEPRQSSPTMDGLGEQVVHTPTITLCMLCQNNEDTIADTLGHIRPYIKDVVVLDLGSHDRSTQIAMEYGARVYQGDMGDSMAAIRNSTISRATSDWILVLDADELLREPEMQAILAVLDAAPPIVMGVRLGTQSLDSRSDGPEHVPRVRLFRNRNEIVFKCRGCEQTESSITRLGGQIVNCDAQIAVRDCQVQNGRSFRSSETLRRLLHLDLAECPGDPLVLFNLGRLHFAISNFFHAECYLNDCLQRSRPEDIHYRTAAMWLIDCHLRKGDPERAREVADYVQGQIPGDDEFQAEVRLRVQSSGAHV